MTHEEWCDLLSTIQVKDNRKRAATQIKKVASARSASLSESDGSVRVPRKKKAVTGVLRSNKGPNRKTPKHNVTQRYYMLCKNAGMPERKYMSHSAEDYTGTRTNQTIKDRIGGYMVSRYDTVKQY